MNPESDSATGNDRVDSYAPSESLHEPIVVEAPSSTTTHDDTDQPPPPGEKTIDLVDDTPNEIKSGEASTPLMEPTPSVDATKDMTNLIPEEVGVVSESNAQNLEEKTKPPPSEIPTDQEPAQSPY